MFDIKINLNKKKTPSEGELFISEYLKFNKIDFDMFVEIHGLKNDTCSYREADFYLNKYNVFVEFEGRWNNSDADKKRYRDKKGAYYRGNVPCVYLYPENLGIIDFVFQKRLIEELKKKSMKKELIKFQLKRFIDDRGGLFVWILICLFVLSGDFSWEEDSTIIVLLIGVILFQLYRLIMGVKMFFIKNEMSF